MSKQEKAEKRSERLVQQLRSNLIKRKQQARDKKQLLADKDQDITIPIENKPL